MTRQYTRRTFNDANDHPITQPEDITLPSSGSIDDFRDTVVEPVTNMNGFQEKAAALAFNEEPVEVLISESTDINPEQFVFLQVNGQGPLPHNNPWVPRGVPVTIARKFVEVLARAKPVSIRTIDAVDRMGGKTTRIQRSAALRYPFSVIRDDNPKGGTWLRHIMAQA